jgi:peptidoglycan-associated lipoprotein
VRNFLIASSVVVLLSACGSSVKLNDVPVEDAKPVPAASTDPVSDVNVRAVQSVTSDASDNLAAKAPAASRIVYFDYDSFLVRPEFQAQIETHAKFIVSNKVPRVMIEGHTDERGGREYNLALGQKRAEAVRQSLKLLGVTESQMEAVSFGKEKPSVSGTTEDAMAKNRRAEINYR